MGIFNMKKITVFTFVLLMAACLTGCGTAVQDMTDEQRDAVTEYATQLIVKYCDGSGRNLLNDTKMEAEKEKEKEIRERNAKMEEAKEAYLKQEESKDKENTEQSGETETSPEEKVQENYLADLGEFLGTPGFELTYQDYELCQSYSEGREEDDFFSVQATEGKQLLAVHFQAVNTSEESQVLDIFEKKCRFFISVNGEQMTEASATLLLDDMIMFRGEIPGGESKPLVVLFEVDQDLSIDSLEMTVKNGEEKGKILVK